MAAEIFRSRRDLGENLDENLGENLDAFLAAEILRSRQDLVENLDEILRSRRDLAEISVKILQGNIYSYCVFIYGQSGL